MSNEHSELLPRVGRGDRMLTAIAKVLVYYASPIPSAMTSRCAVASYHSRRGLPLTEHLRKELSDGTMAFVKLTDIVNLSVPRRGDVLNVVPTKARRHCNSSWQLWALPHHSD